MYMQQIKAFLLPHLTDDDPRRPHPQRLLDQTAQRNLPVALEIGLTGLQSDNVRRTGMPMTTTDHPLTETAGDNHLFKVDDFSSEYSMVRARQFIEVEFEGTKHEGLRLSEAEARGLAAALIAAADDLAVGGDVR
jgi:hypothetical protein